MTGTVSAAFRLQLLGSPSLHNEHGVTPPSLGWGKPFALLCLLAVRSDLRREEVVDLLWRGVDEPRARNAFRQALHRLRGALGDDLIPQDRDRIRLVRSARIAVDLDEFETAASAGRVEEAVQLYSGDLLEGAALDEAPFDQWVEQERVRWRTIFRQALQDAVHVAAGSGQWSDAIARAKRLLSITPFDASAAHLAATTLVSAGRKVEAQELLRQFEVRLDAELGVSLPAELQSLLGRIDRQQRRGAPGADSTSAAAARTPLALPFAGRSAELTQLLTLWRTTGTDSGALALIEGESGIGKTRLVHEVASHARALGRVTVLRGCERVAGAQLPLGVFAEALRPLVHAKGVLGASRHLLAEAARLLPELRDELDLPVVHDVDDDVARLRFFEGVAALVDAAAFEQPILLVLEDLHLLAPSSLELLSYLAVRLAGSAVLFVLTLRPEDAPPSSLSRLRALAEPSPAGSPPHGSRAARLILAPPAVPELRAGIVEMGRKLGVKETVLDRILARTRGHPGRVVELIRAAEDGADVAALPVSLRALIEGRISRLSSAQRRAHLAVALIGRPVTLPLVAAAAHLSDTAARECIDVLVGDGLLERDGEGLHSPSVATDAALELAGQAGRAFLAGWAAEALAAEGGNAAELARLHAAAGNLRLAFEHARRAAYEALAVGAIHEATRLLLAARSFAATADEQREIESLLTSVGSGRQRLAPPGADTPTDRATDGVGGAPDVVITRASAVSERWASLFPNWRVLLGAAVATLVISSAVLATRSAPPLAPVRSPAADTLVVADGSSGAIRYAFADASGAFTVSEKSAPRPSEPPWLDSLSRPWADRLAAPRTQDVAVARVTATGSDVYVIAADRRDTVPLIVGYGDARPLGWSPDGRWLLAITSRTLRDGSFDTDLAAYRVGAEPARIQLDTTARRSVTEASWSPDGSRIAWVARASAGPLRQLEVFVSRADGTEVQNVSRHPADDFHLAWSGDGDLLGFTSMRDGNAEIYAHSFRESRLWRLTRDPAQDDRGQFSFSGRLIAFESTRGGSAGVYVMPSLGGEARRVGADLALTIKDWIGGRGRYVERVRAAPVRPLVTADSADLRLVAFDQLGEPITTSGVRWTVLDSSVAEVVAPHGEQPWRLVARRDGLARVVGNVGGWRSDTTYVRIGTGSWDLLGGTDNGRDWVALGRPAPTTSRVGGQTVLTLNADREWESGMLSRVTVPLNPGLSLSATLTAPFNRAGDPATGVGIALVAPEEATAIDSAAPQFLRVAGVSWSAESGRLVYSVGRELFTEPVAEAAGAALPIQMRILSDSTMSFVVNGRERWRSTLRIHDAYRDSRANVWLGGRATGDLVKLTAVRVGLTAAETRERR